MTRITKIWSREILNSRGRPTVEVAVQLESGHIGVASVPEGASKSEYEAIEVKDQDPSRFDGLGVLKAVENVNKTLGPSLSGLDAVDQTIIDNRLLELDGTQNKSKYGVNAILPISIAVCKAQALSTGKPPYFWINYLCQKINLKTEVKMPTPVFNMINGGLHGAGNLDFQEFHVIPATSKSFGNALQLGAEVYMKIGANLKRRGAIHSVGDEGGFAPNLFTNADALEILVESIRGTTYSFGRDVFLGLDVASSVFYADGKYTIKDRAIPLSDEAMIDFYKTLNSEYKLAILEDPLDQNAWQSWAKLNAVLANEVIVVGDDLLATNITRIEQAIKDKACNGVLVKPNQVGTVSETLRVVKKTKEAGLKVIVSHRSGETNDNFIADFAVGIGADYAKFGAPVRGERVAKYNRLLAIEAELKIS